MNRHGQVVDRRAIAAGRLADIVVDTSLRTADHGFWTAADVSRL